MRAVITGASGTVGRALTTTLAQQGNSAIAWNRQQVPIDAYAPMESFIAAQKPDVVFHLAIPSTPTGQINEGWLAGYQWTSELAWICRQHGIRFVFTSTVMVFTDHATGPFTPESVPDATEGYGYDKLQIEKRVFEQYPEAVVARLGWQIADDFHSNNMLAFLERQMQTEGRVQASQRWYPACSFVEDTASALLALASSNPGTYLVDANTHWNFFQIASALNARHNHRWHITPTDDFIHDQRMIDPRVSIRPLNHRLPLLDN